MSSSSSARPPRGAPLFASAGPHLQTLLGLVGDGLDGPKAEATLASPLRDSRDGALPFGQLLAGSAVDLVREIVVREGRATGVRTTAGLTVDAREAVIVSATPDQLYGRLLRSTPASPRARGHRQPATATGVAASR